MVAELEPHLSGVDPPQSLVAVFGAHAQLLESAQTPNDSPLTWAQQPLVHSLGQVMSQMAWHVSSFVMQT